MNYLRGYEPVYFRINELLEFTYYEHEIPLSVSVINWGDHYSDRGGRNGI